MNQSSAFVTTFNMSSLAVNTAFYWIILKPSFEIVFADLTKNRNDMILKFNNGTSNYWFNLNATVTGNNIKFSRTNQGTGDMYENGNLIEVPMKPLLDYFTTKTFEIN